MKDIADARSDISNQCLKELADANEKLATAERERDEARAALLIIFNSYFAEL